MSRPNENLSVTVNFTLTPEMKQEIARRAAKAQRTMGDYLRVTLAEVFAPDVGSAEIKVLFEFLCVDLDRSQYNAKRELSVILGILGVTHNEEDLPEA